MEEWLVANGLGGYASGTVSGLATRRYHGWLIVPQKDKKSLFINQVSEIIEVFNFGNFYLGMNEWKDHSISPDGSVYLTEFYLEDNIPVWIYQSNHFTLKKTVFMPHEKNRVYIVYKVVDCAKNSKLRCQVFFNNRDFHALSASQNIQPPNIQIKSNDFKIEHKNISYYNHFLREEEARGFDCIENSILGTELTVVMQKGKEYYFLIEENSGENLLIPAEQVKNNLKKRNNILLNTWKKKHRGLLTPAFQKLLLNSDSFIVKRLNSSEDTIIAGYHWFGDWGRDTFISLPGLCLATGRFETAKSILLNYTNYISEGMIPNRFPDNNEIPEYNSMDSSFWFIEACVKYYKATDDKLFLKKIYPFIENIISNHIEGTRYSIHCDKKDGLLYGGYEGSQLTWMDAKCSDISFTPRVGKPIEINALWINALKNMCEFSVYLSKEKKIYEEILNLAEKSFHQFWCEEKGYCYDVLNYEKGHDSSLRPNQIIALSLDFCPLSQEQQKKTLKSCQEFLLTPYGLRSLAPFEKNYIGKYQGNHFERDRSYHQGTVWGWLLGRFAIAYYKVTKNKKVALAFLRPMEHHVMTFGIGYINEIFDGDFPHKPRGCIAQAWSVAEYLWAKSLLSKKI